MMAFAFAAAALALLAAGAVLFGPRQQRRSVGGESQRQTTAAVLRQQLVEVEAEHARGLIDAGELARLRDELQRRLLAEADGGPPAVPSASRPRLALLAYAAALPLAALLLYQHFGHPQLLGAPGAAESQATGEAGGPEDLLKRLEAHLLATPDDARGWVMLARARMQRDEFGPAADAYGRALAASAKVARDPLVWCEYADALGMAAGGSLAGKPRELVDRALALDPAHPRALEMAGSAAYEAGDYPGAARYWQQLLALLPSGSTEHAQLAAAIARVGQRAGLGQPTR
jgi:cytochrome c-type biogenesis protein CcmH